MKPFFITLALALISQATIASPHVACGMLDRFCGGLTEPGKTSCLFDLSTGPNLGLNVKIDDSHPLDLNKWVGHTVRISGLVLADDPQTIIASSAELAERCSAHRP